MSVEKGLDIDDVITAHELLRDYSGDVHGLFSIYPGERITEWRVAGRCSAHGDVANTIGTPDYQPYPASPVYVICPECLELGIRKRIPAALIVRITLGTT